MVSSAWEDLGLRGCLVGVGLVVFVGVGGRGARGFLGGLLVEAGDGERGRRERVDAGFADDGVDLGFEGRDLFVGGLALGDKGVDLDAGIKRRANYVGFGAEYDVAEG